MDVRAATTGTGAALRGRRLPPHEREQMILDEAINFFAEYGFNGQVRQLAERLHVSQALIFRYFGTKDALIERVYQRTFLARWDPAWEITLADQSIPLRIRLKTFLKSYLSVVDDYRWIRISMHSSLAQHDLTHRYVQIFVTNILKVIARQVRLYRGEDAGGDISGDELELVWHLHSTVVYYLVRKHIHKTPVSTDIDRLVGSVVDNFIDGLSSERIGNQRAS